MNNASYLLHACMGNDLIQLIRTIVEKRGIYVNATATYIPANISTTVQGASPLFVAAANGNLEIAQFLIEKGANVNSKTDVRDLFGCAGMSPLHAAICLRRDIEFPKRRAMIELLLANGANLKARDECGLTPLNVAAVGFPHDGSHCSPNETVLRYLLQQDDFSLSEKIDALELAGAMIVFYKEEGISVSQVFRYWNEAQDLRDSAQGEIPKVPMEVVNNVQWRAFEWTTRDELQDLRQRNSYPDLMMQAILATRRILSRINSKGFVHHLWNRFVSKYCSRLYQANRITELLNIYWIMLEGGCFISQRNHEFYKNFMEIIDYLVSCLKKLKEEQSPLFNTDTLMLSLKLLSDIDQSQLHEMDNDLSASWFAHWNQRIQPVIYDLLAILSDIPQIVTHEVRCCLYEFVKRDRRDCFGYNLLIAACRQQPTASTLAIIRLLLEVGADPNTVDERGNAPLHHVVLKMGEASESDSPVATLLLEYGALPHQHNYSKKTPLDLWSRQNTRPGRIPLYPPTWMFTDVMPLMWWCARSIRQNRTPYKRLPENLKNFVSNHY